MNESVAFATITEHVVRQVSGERAGDLAAVVDRHRRLMTSGPAGGGPEVVLDLLGSDLDLRAWVLSPTGRQIAGSGAARCPPPVRATLAGEHLAAARTGPPRRRTGSTLGGVDVLALPGPRHRPRRRPGGPGRARDRAVGLAARRRGGRRATGRRSGSTCSRASPS